MNPESGMSHYGESDRKPVMSLMTRLWLCLALAMLAAMSGSLVVSVLQARNYLAQQLFAQASDSATSLALSMSQQSKDPAMTELLVSALFDSGHFESISYRDTAGRTLVERKATGLQADAPAWFVSLLPLEASPGEAQVSDGWKQAGSVEVRASMLYAYRSLWQGATQIAFTLAVVGLLLGAGVALLMRWAHRPLRDIISQAEAIGNRRFVTLPEPDVPEFRVVARAMNVMVGRVQAMFAEQATRIDQLRSEATRDALTGLPNRSLFLGQLRNQLSDERAVPQGVILIARLRDLAEMNRRLGRDRVDSLLVATGEMLKSLDGVAGRDDCVSRLNGSDFAVLLPGAADDAVMRIATELLGRFDRLKRQGYADTAQVAALGWTTYRHGEQVGDVLVRADANLMQAEARPESMYGGADFPPAVVARSEEWRERFDAAMRARRFELALFPVVRADGSLIHREAMLRMLGDNGERLTAGQFMPAATRLGLTPRMDLLTLELALRRQQERNEDIAVNLSPLSLDDPEFAPRFEALLSSAGMHAKHLWVEFSEHGISEAGGLEALDAFADMLSRYDVKFGIEHFGRHFAAIPRLHELSVDYLKLDGAFIADINSNEGNQRFVKAVVDIARSLDIDVIAEKVSSEAEWTMLRSLGATGMTGPAVTTRFPPG